MEIRHLFDAWQGVEICITELDGLFDEAVDGQLPRVRIEVRDRGHAVDPPP